MSEGPAGGDRDEDPVAVRVVRGVHARLDEPAARRAELAIRSLRTTALARAQSAERAPPAEQAHWFAIAGDFARWLDRRELPHPTPALVAPPGDPFGSAP